MMAILSAYYNLIPITLLQGVIYAFVAPAIMIPFRLLSFPDLTAEGSFPLGASVTAATLAAGLEPISATLLALVAGFAAGATTALIHRIFRLNTLLCGILVVTMLYSIDIRIMGKPNIPMFTYDDLFGMFLGDHTRSLTARILFVLALVLLCTIALYAFLKTEMGFALRAVGASQTMARAQGLSISYYVVLGIGMAGALSAMGGSILAQSQSFADVNMGFGVLVNGLAALIRRAVDRPKHARASACGAARRRHRLLSGGQLCAGTRHAAVGFEAVDRPVRVVVARPAAAAKPRSALGNDRLSVLIYSHHD